MANLPATIVNTAPAPKKNDFPIAFLAVPMLVIAGWFGFQAIPKSTSTTTNAVKSTPIAASSQSFVPSQIEIAPAFLNVRTQPSADAAKLENAGQPVTVVRGESVPVSGERAGWYNVEIQGKTGFINAKYGIPLEPLVSSGALQKLVNAAKNGGTIKLEAGVYVLPNGLELSSNLELEGNGWQSTILLSEARGGTLRSSGGNVTLKNLTVAHNGDAPAAVAIIKNSSLNLSNVRFIGGKDTTNPDGDDGDGLVLYNVSGEISNSFFLGNAWRGLSLRGNSSVSISNSQFSANSGSGIVISGTAQPNLSRNDISGNGLAGIKIFEQADPVLSGNSIANNAKGGINFADQSTATLTDNTCNQNGEYSVKVETKRNPSLAGNLGCEVSAVTPVTIAPTQFNFIGNGTPGVEFAIPPSRAEYLALNTQRNLWNMRLARNKSVNFSAEVGEVLHQARAKPLELYTWGVRWCNSSSSKLQSDLERVNLRLETNGNTLPTVQTFQGVEPAPNGGSQFCYRISTLVRGQPGSFVRLSVVGDVTAYDLESDYNKPFELGEHRMTLDVTF
jgi:parallel beta-helix repeat protein